VALVPAADRARWVAEQVRAGRYRVMGLDGAAWRELATLEQHRNGPVAVDAPATLKSVELLLDRRPDMATEPACRAEDRC
jgi:hypothetical protein